MPLNPPLLVFVLLLLATGGMRLVELGVSVRRMRERKDAVVAEPWLFPLMAILHLGLVATPILEVVLLDRPFLPWLAALAGAGLVLATALRVWTLRSLGRAWNVRVVRPEATAIVRTGPYAWIRHPNYLVVVLEIACLPLLHTAWLSALGLSALNAFVLFHRIRTEEAVLSAIPEWREAMADRWRLIPWVLVLGLAVLAGCGGRVEVGDFSVRVNGDGTLDVDHLELGPQLSGVRLLAGTGDAEITMAYGAFRFEDVDQSLRSSAKWAPPRGRFTPVFLEARGADGEPLGTLLLSPGASDALVLEWTPDTAAVDRLGISADCDASDHFLGLGGHAMDVDHAGEAFALWVSEPGVGKTEDDEVPEGWPLTGAKHAASFPVPFLLRPHRSQGLLVHTNGRVDVDLCASDPERFSAVAWAEDIVRIVLIAGREPLDPVRSFASYSGGYTLPQPWVFAPWNDAIRGAARVREVAARLRDFGAPSSVIWTEDFKGAAQTPYGYQLGGEWTLDEGLYPDAQALATDLEADGFKWFAYFAPFVRSGTRAWDDARAAGVLIEDEDGGIYTFTGFTFEAESLLDLTDPAAQAWAQERMQAALDIGFDGWMADFAEWLPTDAVLASGEDALIAHNAYPSAWQRTNADLLEGVDATFFVRSGWVGTSSLVPAVWGGDQRTSFEPDDGLPTVLPMALGLSASAVPVFTHDVAGYQSVGNPPSDKELWFRWAWLGAFSPILRTHHGAFDTDNWQFDSDDETTRHWARVASEHMRLFPYRYGLAARAAADGTPMILSPALLYGDDDWDRTDVWMLGEALLVAPVLEGGATGRQVDLPVAREWYDWWTREPVQSGHFDAAVDEIPVFAAAGTTVPVFAEVPDTLVPVDVPDLRDLDDVDGARILYLFGGGGPFTEGDGTTYAPSGTASGPGEQTATLASGVVEAAGIQLAIDGPVERTYTVVVIP